MGERHLLIVKQAKVYQEGLAPVLMPEPFERRLPDHSLGIADSRHELLEFTPVAMGMLPRSPTVISVVDDG